MASRRPTIHRHQTQHEAPPNELRMEFGSPNGGGLITFATTDDGRLIVDIGRCDSTVTVRTGGSEFDLRSVIAFMHKNRTRFTDQEFRHAASGKCLMKWEHEYGASGFEYCTYAALSGSLYCARHRDALADANPHTFGVKITDGD